MPDFQDASVRDVMSRPVQAVEPDLPVAEAARRMHESGLSCFLVDLGDPAQGQGILTQKDLLYVLADQGPELGELTVRDVMSHPMVSVPAAYNVRTCMLQMRMLGVRRAAVTEGTEIVGLVTYSDLFRHAVQALGAP